METAIVNLSGNRSQLASTTSHMQPLLFLTGGHDGQYAGSVKLC